MGTHENFIGGMILMSSHNIRFFCGNIENYLRYIPLSHLFWRSGATLFSFFFYYLFTLSLWTFTWKQKKQDSSLKLWHCHWYSHHKQLLITLETKLKVGPRAVGRANGDSFRDIFVFILIHTNIHCGYSSEDSTYHDGSEERLKITTLVHCLELNYR